MEDQIILMRSAAEYSVDGGVTAVSEQDCASALDILSYDTSTEEGEIVRATKPGFPILHSQGDAARLTAEYIGSRANAVLTCSPDLSSLSDEAKEYPTDFRSFVSDCLGATGRLAWEDSGSLLIITSLTPISIIKGRHSVPHCYPFVFKDAEYKLNLCAHRERKCLSRT